MDKRFVNKVALVTGAGSGIGKATALAFASEGAKVLVADRDFSSLTHTVAQIQQAGGEAVACEVDIADSASVQSMMQTCLQRFSRLDHAVNNAGILGAMQALTADYDEGLFNQVIAVNLRGTFLCMKYQIPHLLKTGGTIVNTASIAGLVGIAALSAYSASKHGIIGLTRTAALEYAKQGLRINAVCPGGTRTPMAGFGSGNDAAAAQAAAAFSPNGRVAEPEEMAAAIIWLSSAQSSYVNGHPLVVDGGYVAQ
ncbi:MAG: SDR family oxidoreductase [Pseudomonadota bacterium]